MDLGGYAGLIELGLVFSVAIGWGVLELVGLRLDRRRREERQRAAQDGPPPSAQRPRHPEG